MKADPCLLHVWTCRQFAWTIGSKATSPLPWLTTYSLCCRNASSKENKQSIRPHPSPLTHLPHPTYPPTPPHFTHLAPPFSTLSPIIVIWPPEMCSVYIPAMMCVCTCVCAYMCVGVPWPAPMWTALVPCSTMQGNQWWVWWMGVA